VADLGGILDELMPAIGRVRRLLRRAAGTTFPRDRLTASQREVVLLVATRPGSPVSQVAEELGLATNTVSTLVSRLIADGWLLRETDPADRRVIRLRLTAAAQAEADTVLARRRVALRDALRELPPGQLDDLRAALAALEALSARLHAAEPAASYPGTTAHPEPTAHPDDLGEPRPGSRVRSGRAR